MINGHGPKPEKIQQFIDCGAVVRLDDAVVAHGVIFIHPQLPPMRLMFNLDPEGKKLPQYGMEPIVAEHGDQTQFAIRVHDCSELEPAIEMPPKKKIIMPGDLN